MSDCGGWSGRKGRKLRPWQWGLVHRAVVGYIWGLVVVVNLSSFTIPLVYPNRQGFDAHGLLVQLAADDAPRERLPPPRHYADVPDRISMRRRQNIWGRDAALPVVTRLSFHSL